MYHLRYSIRGEGEWEKFHTDGQYFISSGGNLLTDIFYGDPGTPGGGYQTAREVVREWLEQPNSSHYPVAICSDQPDGTLYVYSIYDTDRWPYVGRSKGVSVHRMPGFQPEFVVVV